MFTSKQLTLGYIGLVALLYVGSYFLPENATSMPAPLKIDSPAATTLDYLKATDLSLNLRNHKILNRADLAIAT